MTYVLPDYNWELVKALFCPTEPQHTQCDLFYLNKMTCSGAKGSFIFPYLTVVVSN